MAYRTPLYPYNVWHTYHDTVQAHISHSLYLIDGGAQHCKVQNNIVWNQMPLLLNSDFLTIYVIAWQCMTMYDIIYECVSNVWQEWMVEPSMQRLRVPGSVAHWSDGDTGVFPLYSTFALFQEPFCCWYLVTLGYFPCSCVYF